MSITSSTLISQPLALLDATSAKVGSAIQANGHPQRGQGLFAKYLQARWPLLPIEEEISLNDPALYENFLVRVYAYHRFRHQVLVEPSVYGLVQFHSRYKFLETFA